MAEGETETLNLSLDEAVNEVTKANGYLPMGPLIKQDFKRHALQVLSNSGEIKAAEIEGSNTISITTSKGQLNKSDWVQWMNELADQFIQKKYPDLTRTSPNASVSAKPAAPQPSADELLDDLMSGGSQYNAQNTTPHTQQPAATDATQQFADELLDDLISGGSQHNAQNTTPHTQQPAATDATQQLADEFLDDLISGRPPTPNTPQPVAMSPQPTPQDPASSGAAQNQAQQGIFGILSFEEAFDKMANAGLGPDKQLQFHQQMLNALTQARAKPEPVSNQTAVFAQFKDQASLDQWAAYVSNSVDNFIKQNPQQNLQQAQRVNQLQSQPNALNPAHSQRPPAPATVRPQQPQPAPATVRPQQPQPVASTASPHKTLDLQAFAKTTRKAMKNGKTKEINANNGTQIIFGLDSDGNFTIEGKGRNNIDYKVIVNRKGQVFENGNKCDNNQSEWANWALKQVKPDQVPKPESKRSRAREKLREIFSRPDLKSNNRFRS